jgi:hypothetical protein
MSTTMTDHVPLARLTNPGLAKTTWSLVSTMLGTPETILPCVAHHLASDAEAFHIYLDAPHPVVEDALKSLPRCVLTVCNDAYWAAKPGGRPEGVVRRQLANLADARARTRSEWMVHLDSDEFLVAAKEGSNVALGDELAGVSSEFEWVRILPMERVLLPVLEQKALFDGVFRKPCKDADVIQAIYREGARFLHHGMSGHVRGKIAVRPKTKLVTRLHEASFPPAPGTKLPFITKPQDLPPHAVLAGTRLLHFEGWTRSHWLDKLNSFAVRGLYTGHGPGRGAAIQFVAQNPDEVRRHSLFERVQRLSCRGLRIACEADLIRGSPFDPSDVTRVTFPGIDFDFSVVAFEEARNSGR